MKKWKLDPTKSARDNLWDVIDKFSTVLLKCKRLRLTDYEFDDLLMDIRLSSYNSFMTKLRNGKYRHDLTFFQNVHSSCWSASGDCTDRYLKRIKQRINMLDYIDEEHAPLIALSYESKTRKKLRGIPELQLRDVDLEYDDYCCCCEEFGIEPISREQFRIRNAEPGNARPSTVPPASSSR